MCKKISFLPLIALYFVILSGNAMAEVGEEVKTNTLVILQAPMPTIVPVGGGKVKVEIINKGTEDAYNVDVKLPDEWSNVILNKDDCFTISANGGKCNLTLSSEQPHIAKFIYIKGENTAKLKKPIAFSINGFLVSKVNEQEQTATILYNKINKKQKWIYEFWDEEYLVGALSVTDGMSNTKKMYHVYQNDNSWNLDRGNNYGAGVYCAKLKDFGAHWYLPALTQVYQGRPEGDRYINNLDAYNRSNDSSINRLFQFGFIPPNYYWTSTEVKKTYDSRGLPLAKFVRLEKKGRQDLSSAFMNERDIKHNSICIKDIAY